MLIRKLYVIHLDPVLNVFPSFSTRDTLQDTARLQFENNKKSRRHIFAQAAAKGNEWGRSEPINVPAPLLSKVRDISQAPRMRSGSGTSRSTTDSGENDILLQPSQPSSQHSLSASSSPSQPSVHSAGYGSFFNISSSSSRGPVAVASAGSSTSTFSIVSPTSSSLLSTPAYPALSLSPIATRMRERDADAMEKYMMRNRSGSSSTDNKSQNGSSFSSAGPSANGDDITSLAYPSASGTSTPRKFLRPSLSAAQLRTGQEVSHVAVTTVPQQAEARIRAGTSPGHPRPSLAPLHLIRASSQTKSHRTTGKVTRDVDPDKESFTGPPIQYAQFPDPPSSIDQDHSTPTIGRRLPFHLLSKLPLDSSAGHRRGASATSVRGG